MLNTEQRERACQLSKMFLGTRSAWKKLGERGITGWVSEDKGEKDADGKPMEALRTHHGSKVFSVQPGSRFTEEQVLEQLEAVYARALAQQQKIERRRHRLNWIAQAAGRAGEL